MQPGATEQQREVIAAVLRSPELAGVLAKLLKEVGNDPDLLSQYPKSDLIKALATLPDAPVTSLREKFDSICVKVIINGQPFDVAVLDETIGKPHPAQAAIAEEIGGQIATRTENQAVVNYLLDRDACSLLAHEKSVQTTPEKDESYYLSKHRERFAQDNEAALRAETAGAITDKEAALLKIYKNWIVRDTEGGLDVYGHRAHDSGVSYSDNRNSGVLILRLSAKSE